AATRVLGSAALCVTANSASYPERHRAMALETASRFGFQHEVISTAELENPAYRANNSDRCYHCKHELFTRLTALARDRGFAVVADGNNADDRGDYRPGRKAAREFGVVSPLDESGLTKDDIRELSHEVGLPVVACAVLLRSDRGEASRDRTVRAGAARPRVPRASRASSRRRGTNRARARRASARDRARNGRPHRPRPARGRIQVRDGRSEG